MLWTIDPELAPTFIAFDDLSWKAIYQYPEFQSRVMRAKRDQTQRALRRYFEVPQSRKTRNRWFITTNTRKTAFWMLTYLHNPSYIEPLRKKTAAAFIGDRLVDLGHMHKNCPLLESLWFETMRMAPNVASVRLIIKDTTIIGNKIPRKSNRIMIPYRLLHFDETVYGPNVCPFKPERFAGTNAEKPTRGDSWRPFGGGKTMCSGRHILDLITRCTVAPAARFSPPNFTIPNFI
ncbi:hypothetical protein DTO271G3_7079 [Paecilomyces variotii]|nr:hypothetical protein DTO271G3_7079 [Paecilomyces variotii]